MPCNQRGLHHSLQDALGDEVQSIVPQTFHLSCDLESHADELERFNAVCDENEVQSKADRKETFWIVKPASNTNRGQGIKVVESRDCVLKILASAKRKRVKAEEKKKKRGRGDFIVQRYTCIILFSTVVENSIFAVSCS